MIWAHRRAPLMIGSVVIFVAVGYVALYRASPGELATGHAAVAGSPLITDCNKCHAPQGLAFGCLACHSEIHEQLSRKHGYHAYVLAGKPLECGHCHSDHNGRQFQLINPVSWQNKDPVKTFKHPQVDYQLTGKHLTVACEKCHQAKWTPVYHLPKFPKMRRDKTFLGQTQSCINCHEDIHAHGLAVGCKSCHGQEAWRPTTPRFNHDKFFALRGGHANLKCAQCHLFPEKRALNVDPHKFPFDRVKGKTCVDCHKSPHAAKWVDRCEACHKAHDKSWDAADRRMTKKQHAMAGFRLNVPHQKTKCLDCHGPDLPTIPFKVKYPNPHVAGYRRFEKNCEACHKDEHRGQFTPNHAHCVDCHARAAFMPPAYGVKDHRTYALLGGHRTASCNTCHIRDAKTRVRQYIPTPTNCAACHKDIHHGQFRKENGKTLCEDCHRSSVSWSKVSFDHNTQSRFKLDKAHANVGCKECHPRVTAGGASLVQYKPLRMLCRDCHDFDH